MSNKEMIEGFMDGYDLNNPDPSDNRSHSYKHGFKAGRNDKLPEKKKPFTSMSYDQIIKMSEEAMLKDENNFI